MVGLAHFTSAASQNWSRHLVLLAAVSIGRCVRGPRCETNGIGGQGAQHLAAALQHNSALTTLNLETNDIGGQGAQHLADTT